MVDASTKIKFGKRVTSSPVTPLKGRRNFCKEKELRSAIASQSDELLVPKRFYWIQTGGFPCGPDSKYQTNAHTGDEAADWGPQRNIGR